VRTLATFLLSALVGAVLCALGLVTSYDFMTDSNRNVPYAYSEFLLEHISAPRIVIDAGSSSAFGIDPILIEQAFRTPVIDVADNGSIPLEMKIYRLLKFARQGDTLILPLEWVYYTRDTVPQDFTDKTPDEYAAYYASQPFLERLVFSIWHLSLHNFSDAGRLYLRSDLRREHVVRIQADMAAWPLGGYKDDRRRRSSVEGIGCADYIASVGNIPPVVEWAAKQLSDLQTRRDVRVYVTWPAVAGTDCYIMPDGRLPIADKARAIFERHGITVIGEPADSYFTPEHMLDTYYHIDSTAARQRTDRLVARLQSAGMKSGLVGSKGTNTLANDAMRALELLINGRNPAISPVLAPSNLRRSGRQSREPLCIHPTLIPPLGFRRRVTPCRFGVLDIREYHRSKMGLLLREVLMRNGSSNAVIGVGSNEFLVGPRHFHRQRG
jgi:hypothetical protein